MKYLILLLILIDEMECITYLAGVVCGEGPGEPGPFSPGLLGHAHRELKTLRIIFIRINRKSVVVLELEDDTEVEKIIIPNFPRKSGDVKRFTSSKSICL